MLDSLDCAGCYREDKKAIYLPSSYRSSYNLLTLLHEIKHAIQHKKGSLANYYKSWRQLWRLECSADDFANKHYKVMYRKKFGVRRLYRAKKYYRNFWLEDIKPTRDEIRDKIEELTEKYGL